MSYFVEAGYLHSSNRDSTGKEVIKNLGPCDFDVLPQGKVATRDLYNPVWTILNERSGVSAAALNLNEQKPVGTLTKAFGIKGYQVAGVGTNVYEAYDRYYITLQHDTLEPLKVQFYKKELQGSINFIQ